jgi:predicted GH43/DUF377 family glycosyl hydrolase
MSSLKDESDLESMQWNRRRFLQAAAVATGATLSVPGAAAESPRTSAATPHKSLQAQIGQIDEPTLPEWAIGPFRRYSNPQAVPYEGNPVLTPQGPLHGDPPGWESTNTLNPGVVFYQGKFHMLYRAQSPKDRPGYESSVGYAYSEDGHHFTRHPDPVIPHTGNVDPRLYVFDGKVYTYYVATGGVHVASSTDMIHWTELGIALPREKHGFDPALVADPYGNPVKIDGRYVMYFGQGRGFSVAFSDDLVHWTDYRSISMHFPGSYNPWETCYAVTDYPTVEGRPLNRDIVVFVAGGLMSQGRWYYAITEVCFSRSDLGRQVGQLTFPILQPTMPYEILGTTFNTVWMNSLIFHQGQWWMYYGACDRVVGLANAQLRSHESLDRYNHFRGTSFETNQRMPDWVNEVDVDAGGGGSKNVGEFDNSKIGGPQAMVTYGYAPPPEDGQPKKIQDIANPIIRVYDNRSHSGSAALLYSGCAQGEAENYAYLKVFDLSKQPVAVKAATKLSYWIYPEDADAFPETSGLNSTHIALDLVFSDGSALRNIKAQDQHGNPLTPEGQGGHLTPNQWNYVESHIGKVAAGKQIVRIGIGYSQPQASGSYRGLIDDIALDLG